MFLKTWSTQNMRDLDNLEEIISPSMYITKKHGEVTDLSSISFQASFGLQNERIQNSITQQVNQNSLSFPAFSNKLIDRVSKKLVNFIGQEGKIFYTTSGAESVSNAIKILRQSTKKNIIYSIKKSYHGAINESLEVTGDWRRKNNDLPTHQHRWLPSPTEDPFFKKSFALLKKNKIKLCGIIIEPTSGKNGVFTPPKTWWYGLKQARKALKFKIILDEVICGFYRTGKAFGFLQHKIKPDAICMAKGITGGFVPFGATFIDRKSCKYFDENILSAGLTNFAHPLGLAACEEVLNLCQSKRFINTLSKNIITLNSFSSSIQGFDIIKKTRVNGMLMAIELSSKIKNNFFIKNGFGVIKNKSTFILAPHLNMKPSELKKSLLDMYKLLKEVNDNPNVLKETA